MNKPFHKSHSVLRNIPRTAEIHSVPGSGGYVGEKRETDVKLQVLDYNENVVIEKELSSVSDILSYIGKNTVTWLNVSGVHNESILQELGKCFNIHPLVLEDIANTTQRPKLDEYDDYLFVVLKMINLESNSEEIVMEQISLIVGKDYVISLQEKEGDVLDSLRQRIRYGKGKIRKQGSDYLLYGIFDCVVDYYFTVLENVGESIENLEENLMHSPDQKLLNRIYGLKRELVFMRKSVWPMREVVSAIQHSDHDIIKQSTSVFFRDVYDHTIQIVETVETFRDMMTGMLDLYLSTVSNRMNEVMKVLTIFAAIFIPLTFIAGVYGMNFEFMPELKWKLGYAVWWVVVVSLTIGMLIYFKRKKWL